MTLEELDQLLNKQIETLERVRPLGEHLDLLRRYVNGTFDDANRIEATIDLLLSALLGTTVGQQIDAPRVFLESDAGKLITAAQQKLLRGKLITMTEASFILRGDNLKNDLMYVYYLIKKGKLKVYIDMSVNNPSHRKRLLRSEVLKIKEQVEADGDPNHQESRAKANRVR